MKLKQTLIKKLKSQLAEVDGEMQSIRTELSAKQKELNLKKKIFDELLNKIKDIEKEIEVGEICISEHAFLRYFERVLGYNLDEISKEILTEKVLELSKSLGENGTYPSGKLNKEGKEYRVTLKNNTVVTVGV